jgi:hypothetical protein
MVSPCDKGDRLCFVPQYDARTRRGGIVEHKGDLLSTVQRRVRCPVGDDAMERYGPGDSCRDAARYQQKTQEDQAQQGGLQTPYGWLWEAVVSKEHGNLPSLKCR